MTSTIDEREGEFARTVRHTVTVRHAVTGRALPGIEARLVPPTPWWWAAREVDGQVLVHAQKHLALSDPALPPAVRAARRPVLRISVADPLVAMLISNPVVEIVVTGDPTIDLVPTPQTVSVVLRTAAGAPATGRTVTLAPPGQPAIAVPAVPGASGTYATASRTWTAAETPFDLTVNGTVVDRFALDPFQSDTRLHAISA